jgi:proteasome lid subunit RPN8/RPN11
VTAHARAEQPRECCGLLIGTRGEAFTVLEICEAMPTANIAEGESRFEIEPADHIAARRSARERGLAIVGVYHSHPQTPALPSPRDLAEASYAEYLYGIVSLAGDVPCFRLFALEDGAFVEMTVAIEP